MAGNSKGAEDTKNEGQQGQNPDEGNARQQDPPVANGGEDLAEQLEKLKAENAQLKANSRKWEKRSKENSQAAKDLADAQKTAKTAEERIAAIEAELEAAKARDARLAAAQEVAKDQGISVEAVLAMQGNTVEELTASAEAVKTAMPAYPVVDTGTHPNPAVQTRESIMAITNKRERKAAIAKNLDLFN